MKIGIDLLICTPQGVKPTLLPRFANNLKVVVDSVKLTRNINKKKKPAVLQAHNVLFVKHAVCKIFLQSVCGIL